MTWAREPSDIPSDGNKVEMPVNLSALHLTLNGHFRTVSPAEKKQIKNQGRAQPRIHVCLSGVVGGLSTAVLTSPKLQCSVNPRPEFFGLKRRHPVPVYNSSDKFG